MKFKEWLLLESKNAIISQAANILTKRGIITDKKQATEKVNEILNYLKQFDVKWYKKLLLIYAIFYKPEREEFIKRLLKRISEIVQDPKIVVEFNKSEKKYKLIFGIHNQQREFYEEGWLTFNEFIDYIETRRIIKKIKQEKEHNNLAGLQPIVSKNRIVIYEVRHAFDAIKLGKGYTFCISGDDKYNIYDEYRKDYKFYFVFDKNRKKSDPLHIVVIQIGKNVNNVQDESKWKLYEREQSILLTDANNYTGYIKDPLKQQGDGNHVYNYFTYLKSKGININIFKYTPPSKSEKKYENIIHGSKSSTWFSSLNKTERVAYVIKYENYLTKKQLEILIKDTKNIREDKDIRTILDLHISKNKPITYYIYKRLQKEDQINAEKYLSSRMRVLEEDKAEWWELYPEKIFDRYDENSILHNIHDFITSAKEDLKLRLEGYQQIPKYITEYLDYIISHTGSDQIFRYMLFFCNIHNLVDNKIKQILKSKGIKQSVYNIFFSPEYSPFSLNNIQKIIHKNYNDYNFSNFFKSWDLILTETFNKNKIKEYINVYMNHNPSCEEIETMINSMVAGVNTQLMIKEIIINYKNLIKEKKCKVGLIPLLYSLSDKSLLDVADSFTYNNADIHTIENIIHDKNISQGLKYALKNIDALLKLADKNTNLFVGLLHTIRNSIFNDKEKRDILLRKIYDLLQKEIVLEYTVKALFEILYSISQSGTSFSKFLYNYIKNGNIKNTENALNIVINLYHILKNSGAVEVFTNVIRLLKEIFPDIIARISKSLLIDVSFINKQDNNELVDEFIKDGVIIPSLPPHDRNVLDGFYVNIHYKYLNKNYTDILKNKINDGTIKKLSDITLISYNNKSIFTLLLILSSLDNKIIEYLFNNEKNKVKTATIILYHSIKYYEIANFIKEKLPIILKYGYDAQSVIQKLNNNEIWLVVKFLSIFLTYHEDYTLANKLITSHFISKINSNPNVNIYQDIIPIVSQGNLYLVGDDTYLPGYFKFMNLLSKKQLINSISEDVIIKLTNTLINYKERYDDNRKTTIVNILKNIFDKYNNEKVKITITRIILDSKLYSSYEMSDKPSIAKIYPYLLKYAMKYTIMSDYIYDIRPFIISSLMNNIMRYNVPLRNIVTMKEIQQFLEKISELAKTSGQAQDTKAVTEKFIEYLST